MSDCEHDPIGSNNCIRIKLFLDLLEVLVTYGTSNLVSCAMVEEQDFGPIVIVNLLPIVKKIVKHGDGDRPLLKTGAGMAGKLQWHDVAPFVVILDCS